VHAGSGWRAARATGKRAQRSCCAIYAGLGYGESPVPEDKEPPTKVDVRPGQLWEFTDRSGIARRAFVVRVTDPIEGVRQVYLRRVGSGAPVRSTLRRLERPAEGVHLVEDCAAPQPFEPLPDREVPIPTQPEASRKTLHQPRMSAGDRREALATARKLQARGRTPGQIAQALSVLPEIVEGWLRELPVAK
jgi:hypothetical protein